ncbi:hypothetical protein D3C81_463540 [compost metagenome]
MQNAQNTFSKEKQHDAQHQTDGQIQRDGVARHLCGFSRFFRTQILSYHDCRPVANDFKDDNRNCNDLVGCADTRNGIVGYRTEHKCIDTAHQHKQKDFQKDRPCKPREIHRFAVRRHLRFYRLSRHSC